jgi:hypothetical protein
MAKKRIKVKGKPPRGLSKAQRIKIAPLQRKRNKIVSSERNRMDPFDTSESTLDAIDRYDAMIDEIAERPDIASRPSSTRKKQVKEGNRKFIGPRRLRSEIGEDVKARSQDLDYIRGKSPTDVVDYMLGKTRYRQPKKLRAPERGRLSRDDYNPNAEEHSYGIGGIAKSKRLKYLLERLMLRHLGGGQEFDAQD